MSSLFVTSDEINCIVSCLATVNFFLFSSFFFCLFFFRLYILRLRVNYI